MNYINNNYTYKNIANIITLLIHIVVTIGVMGFMQPNDIFMMIGTIILSFVACMIVDLLMLLVIMFIICIAIKSADNKNDSDEE